MLETKFQIATDKLITYWKGERVESRKIRRTLTRLDKMAAAKANAKAEDWKAWESMRQAPEENRRRIGESLARLAESDAVVRYLVGVLAPPEPEPADPRLGYEDFALEIGPGNGGGLTVRVESPAGEGEEDNPFPFAIDELGSLIHSIEGRVCRSGARKAHPAQRRRGKLIEVTPKELGHRLFNALFQGSVLKRWIASLTQIRERRHLGLRLRLIFNLGKDPRLDAIAALPWELLCDPETGDYLSLENSVVRFLTLPRATLPPPVAPPLRVLLMPSNPSDLRPLQLAHEHERIAGAWRALPAVRVETVKADLASLREYLQAAEYNVLHFMGHGEFGDEGELLLEAADGSSEPMTGRILGSVLRTAPSLRLVVLNACSSGEMPRRHGLDPYSSVASALVAAGLPAVVAMQFPVFDETASIFSEKLYRRLAAGDSPEAAVTKGRLAIHDHDPESLEWATPVLYLRALDGGIVRGIIDGDLR